MDYQYDQNSGKGAKSGSDLGFWITVGVLFCIGLWPIGLIMLITKLSDRKKKGTGTTCRTAKTSTASGTGTASGKKKTVEKMTRTPAAKSKTARNMRIGGIVMMVLGGAAVLSVLSELGMYIRFEDFWWLVEDLFPGVGFLAGGIALLAGSRAMTNRLRRFGKYLAVAGKGSSVSMERLAQAAEVKVSRVENDLEQMIDQGLWGEGAYLDLGAGKLYRSAQAAAEDTAQAARKAAEAAVPHETEQGYSGILREIRRANDRIADEAVSVKIDRLEQISARIFQLVEREPQKKAAASTFLNYYLPTTLKLLNSYAEFEEAGVSGKNLTEAKARIERIMDNLVAGFERQLDELYRSDNMHGHRAEFSAFRVKVKGVSHSVSSVTEALTFFVNQRNLNSWSLHDFLLSCRSENSVP